MSYLRRIYPLQDFGWPFLLPVVYTSTVPSFFSAGTTSNTGFKLALRVTITPTLINPHSWNAPAHITVDTCGKKFFPTPSNNIGP